MIEQPDLFSAPLPGRYRHGQPDTARDAAERVAPRTGTQRAAVLLALASAGEHGMTDYELSVACRISRPHVAGTRRKDLTDLGLVVPTSERRPTDSGSLAVVHRITELGREHARQLAAA